jgi:Ca2+-binding EF-hand superfamily protein
MKHSHIAALTIGSALVIAGIALAGESKDAKGNSPHHHEGRGSKHLFERMDTNKDGKITRDEARQAGERMFQQMDQDKNGSVTPAEAEAGMKALKAEKMEERFSALDLNKDGRISADESKMPPQRFARIDANNDGALTREELRAAFAARAERHAGKSGKPQFERMDADKDGKVTKAEALAAANERFARLDTNKDGTITEAELKQHKGRRHAEGGKPKAPETAH